VVQALTAPGGALLKGAQIQVLVVQAAKPKNGPHGVVQLDTCRETTCPSKSVPCDALKIDKKETKVMYVNCN
jgi:hypothetical protein